MLDERYGRSKQKARRQLIVWRSVSATLVVAFLAWGITVAIEEGEKIGYQDSGFTLAPSYAEVSFHLSAPKSVNAPVTCAVQALNQSYSIVGYREVQIAVADLASEQTVRINTSELAVTALVDHCWRG